MEPEEVEPEEVEVGVPSRRRLSTLFLSWDRTPGHQEGSTLSSLWGPPLEATCLGDSSCLPSQAWL